MTSKKKYILTDSCFFYEKKGERRVPHTIEVVDLYTGSVKQLKSGTVIKVVKERG